MLKTLKVGLLRETKNPPDKRVPLIPIQIATLKKVYPHVDFFVQPSDIRCYTNEEYRSYDITLKEDLNECDILLGIKEVDKNTLIPGKTYLFFAHVGKKQIYNREMLKEIIARQITLIDYEYLVTDDGIRAVAFGRYAGIVGAYNGLRAWEILKGRNRLKPAHQYNSLKEMWSGLHLMDMDPGLKVLVTGLGRVANGAMETLGMCNFTRVGPDDFLAREFRIPVVCQIGPEHYVTHREGKPFNFDDFLNDPARYKSSFPRYTRATDILITGHYWDPRSPFFFSKDDMKKPDFRISVIADISCDLNGPVPSTIRSTSISDPFYGYNRDTGSEEPPFISPSDITVMAIDNLPGELPRDASGDFGEQLMNGILRFLFTGTEIPMIKSATITREGQLTKKFMYLEDFIMNCKH